MVRKQVDSVASRLAEEYAAQVPPTDVKSLVETTYQRLASAPVQTFVPIFVDRTVRAELRHRVAV